MNTQSVQKVESSPTFVSEIQEKLDGLASLSSREDECLTMLASRLRVICKPIPEKNLKEVEYKEPAEASPFKTHLDTLCMFSSERIRRMEEIMDLLEL